VTWKLEAMKSSSGPMGLRALALTEIILSRILPEFCNDGIVLSQMVSASWRKNL
jgi:hypothetical protein